MATYAMLSITFTRATSHQTMQDAINGCRPRQQYQYLIVFNDPSNAIVPIEDVRQATFESCVAQRLAVSQIVSIDRGDKDDYSILVWNQILASVASVEATGNTVEGF